MAKKTKNSGKQPDIKTKRHGIFQLAGWNNHIVIPVDEEKNPYGIEREFKKIGICLNVGVLKNGNWTNVPIWISTAQFANLESAIEEFKPQLKELATFEKALEGDLK